MNYHTDTVSDILKEVPLPKMVRVRQKFLQNKVEDVPETVRRELARAKIRQRIRPGMTVALTCGSRGVANIAVVLRETAAVLREAGAYPFIIPAMGSHGGATAEGQKKILTSYGVTEEFCGCPVRATMEVKQIAVTEGGEPVYIDRYAAEADGIIPINRIKPHTDFQYTYESGVMKILTIGLGKQKGAETCHRWGPDYLARRIEMFANCILDHANVLFGIGLVENAYDETCLIRGMTPAEIRTEEPKLLKIAYQSMAQILFKNIDVLVVDKIGKEISGSGADPNITGKFATNCVKEGMVQASKRIYLDLTDITDGNACGVGLCDIITERLYRKIDIDKTYPNSITSTILNASKIPIFVRNQKEALQLGVYSCNCPDQKRVKMVRVSTTAELGEIFISEALLEEARQNPKVEILSEPEEMTFDENGDLFPDSFIL